MDHQSTQTVLRGRKAWLWKIEQEPERSHWDRAEKRTSNERFAYMTEQGYELGSF
jgi:hypothetical protein